MLQGRTSGGGAVFPSVANHNFGGIWIRHKACKEKMIALSTFSMVLSRAVPGSKCSRGQGDMMSHRMYRPVSLPCSQNCSIEALYELKGRRGLKNVQVVPCSGASTAAGTHCTCYPQTQKLHPPSSSGPQHTHTPNLSGAQNSQVSFDLKEFHFQHLLPPKIPR